MADLSSLTIYGSNIAAIFKETNLTKFKTEVHKAV
jgi:hypothetical protein